jgi:hypothetical protein
MMRLEFCKYHSCKLSIVDGSRRDEKSSTGIDQPPKTKTTNSPWYRVNTNNESPFKNKKNLENPPSFNCQLNSQPATVYRQLNA